MSGTVPKYYLVKVDKQRMFLTFTQAVTAYNNPFIKFSFGRYVMDEKFLVFRMTDEDRERVASVAEKCGENQ